MHKMATTMVTIAIAGTAAAVAYGCMKPGAKQQLKKDAKNTFEDMGDIKESMSDVREDVSQMARNLKKEM